MRVGTLLLWFTVGVVCMSTFGMADDILEGKYSWALLNMVLAMVNERHAIRIKRILDRYG